MYIQAELIDIATHLAAYDIARQHVGLHYAFSNPTRQYNLPVAKHSSVPADQQAADITG